MFLFSAASGASLDDAHPATSEETFWLPGEEQTGERSLSHGNCSVRDHAGAGKDLFVFRAARKGQAYTFLGQMICASWQRQAVPDQDGRPRWAIGFALVDHSLASIPDTAANNVSASLALLRAHAYAALCPPEELLEENRLHSVRQRSCAIRDYVLARSVGRCESCADPTPLRSINGASCLQLHHMRRLSDGGLEDPQHIVAVCPACHQRIHQGEEGKAISDRLAQTISRMEFSLSEVRGG